MPESKPTLFGIPVIVNRYLPKNSFLLVDRNGPKPILYIENESMADTLYRAIDSDAGFLRRCGIIVHLGELPHA